MSFSLSTFFPKNFSSKIWIRFLTPSNILFSDQISPSLSANSSTNFNSFPSSPRLFLPITVSFTKQRFGKKTASKSSIILNFNQPTLYDMNDLRELRASMKRKRKQTASERDFEMPEITFSSKFPKNESKFRIENIFRFLSENFRIKLKNDSEMIIFSSLPFLPSKTLPRPFFSRISVKIFHDDAFPAKLKSTIMKKKTKKIAFLNFKLNNDVQMPALYDDYNKLCNSDQIIFHQNYVNPFQRKTVHAEMIRAYNKNLKEHITTRQKTIDSWTKKRKTWKTEFVAAVFEKNENIIKFFRDFQETMHLLKKWNKNDMLMKWKRYRSILDFDLNEFEENDLPNDEIIISIKKAQTSTISKKRITTKTINVDDLTAKINKTNWFFYAFFWHFLRWLLFLTYWYFIFDSLTNAFCVDSFHNCFFESRHFAKTFVWVVFFLKKNFFWV